MIELLLYANIHCQDLTDIIGRVRSNNSLSDLEKTEIVETLKESTPKCPWDAND